MRFLLHATHQTNTPEIHYSIVVRIVKRLKSKRSEYGLQPQGAYEQSHNLTSLDDFIIIITIDTLEHE